VVLLLYDHYFIDVILKFYNTTTNAYNILVGKPEGKKPVGRPRHRWENNIRMDLTK
jgi:hypothetical protein